MQLTSTAELSVEYASANGKQEMREERRDTFPLSSPPGELPRVQFSSQIPCGLQTTFSSDLLSPRGSYVALVNTMMCCPALLYIFPCLCLFCPLIILSFHLPKQCEHFNPCLRVCLEYLG